MTPQYVDDTVSRGKFDREIREYRAREGEYRRRGWLLIQADFPHVLVVMAAPQVKPPAVVTGVLFDYTNYDAEPPSVQLVDPFTSQPYLAKDLPTTLAREVAGLVPVPGMFGPDVPQLRQLQPYMVAHSPEELPFLCIEGVREYHRHPAHTGDAWELHRASGAGRLVRLLEIVDTYGVRSVKGYSLQVQLVPQITGLQVEPPQ